jgi:hypothetical protein
MDDKGKRPHCQGKRQDMPASKENACQDRENQVQDFLPNWRGPAAPQTSPEES